MVAETKYRVNQLINDLYNRNHIDKITKSLKHGFAKHQTRLAFQNYTPSQKYTNVSRFAICKSNYTEDLYVLCKVHKITKNGKFK